MTAQRLPPSNTETTASNEPAVLAALSVAKRGRIYDLEVERYRGMPLWEGHPAFDVLTYRTPRGIRNQGDQDWLLPPNNRWNIGVISDFVLGTTHSGTHIDALSHITVGDDSRWHGGFTEAEHLGDFGPLHQHAADIPAFVCRGILLDVAASVGHERLPRGYGITREDLERAAERHGISVATGDAVLLRTGQMAAWPRQEDLAQTVGSGLTLEAAEWLVETRGARLLGNDTESFEQVPAADPTHPNPVHKYLLVERGIHILENLYLEELAREQVHEFLFIVLPLKIRGATGSMVRPVAIA